MWEMQHKRAERHAGLHEAMKVCADRGGWRDNQKGTLAQCCIPLWVHLVHRGAAVAAQVRVLQAPQLARASAPAEVCCDCLACNCKIKPYYWICFAADHTADLRRAHKHCAEHQHAGRLHTPWWRWWLSKADLTSSITEGCSCDILGYLSEQLAWHNATWPLLPRDGMTGTHELHKVHECLSGI